MAHLYQRGGKKIWYAKYYRNGKQVLKSLKTTNFRIARDKAKILEAGLDLHEYENGVITPANNMPGSRIPIAETLEEFCRHLRDIQTKNSYDSEISRLRQMFGPVCPSLEYSIRPRTQERPPIRIDYLHELTVPDIQKCFEAQRRNRVSPATELRNRAILHKLFAWAFRHYGFRSTDNPRYPNPVDAIKRPVLKAPVIRFLEKGNIKRQLKALKDRPQLQAMVAVCIYAGLRREEVVWLTCEDVDLERRLISVRAKAVHGMFWQPKTKKNRAVPVSQDLLKMLRTYESGEDSVWYFQSSNGNRWHPDTFSHHLADINDKASLDWTCLDFRHTFGSQLARRGVSLYKISELMGNSPEICRRHYAAIRTEHLHEDVEFG